MLVVGNGAGAIEVPGAQVMISPANLGVPGGRDLGASVTEQAIVGFSTTMPSPGVHEHAAAEFAGARTLGRWHFGWSTSGRTARRHIPRPGGGDPGRARDVACSSAARALCGGPAYEEIGGYFADLFYGHEEIELAWRLVDAGWSISYLADVEVFHPHTEICGTPMAGSSPDAIECGSHDGRSVASWTGARHGVAGARGVRAPKGTCRRSYLRRLRSGWSRRIEPARSGGEPSGARQPRSSSDHLTAARSWARHALLPPPLASGLMRAVPDRVAALAAPISRSIVASRRPCWRWSETLFGFVSGPSHGRAARRCPRSGRVPGDAARAPRRAHDRDRRPDRLPSSRISVMPSLRACRSTPPAHDVEVFVVDRPRITWCSASMLGDRDRALAALRWPATPTAGTCEWRRQRACHQVARDVTAPRSGAVTFGASLAGV